MRATSALLALCLALSACATTGGTGSAWVPLIDTKDTDAAKLLTDITECQAYADKTMSAAQGAAVGALAGALLGAVLAGAVGASRNDGAAFGATVGGVRGATDAEGGQRGITSRCLAGRGYKVLN